MVDYLTAANLAVLLLAALAGFFVSFLFGNRGGGCLGAIVGTIVLGVIVLALARGYSVVIENMTQTLTDYIYFNGIGVVGFLLGLLIGVIAGQRK